MSQQLPLAALPSQTLSIVLGRQKCQISVYQKNDALYFDLTANGDSVVRTRVCRNKIRILLDAQYHRFAGDFVMVDTQGDTQPQYTGLGTRYFLLYLTADEIA